MMGTPQIRTNLRTIYSCNHKVTLWLPWLLDLGNRKRSFEISIENVHEHSSNLLLILSKHVSNSWGNDRRNCWNILASWVALLLTLIWKFNKSWKIRSFHNTFTTQGMTIHSKKYPLFQVSGMSFWSTFEGIQSYTMDVTVTCQFFIARESTKHIEWHRVNLGDKCQQFRGKPISTSTLCLRAI